MVEKKLDPLYEEAKDVQKDFVIRDTADALVQTVFSEGRMTGVLYDLLGLNIPSAGSKRLMVNLVRTSIIDRATMLAMLPDPKYDVPSAPEDEALTEQDVLLNLLRTYWDYWNVAAVYRDAGLWLAMKNKAVFYLFPDFQRKMPRLMSLDPNICYPVVDSYGEIRKMFVITKKRGRDILVEYPTAVDVKNDNSLYECVHCWDSKTFRLFINEREVPGVGVEHNLGFVPFQYIQGQTVPGTLGGASNAYQSIALGENFTDMMMLTSQEVRNRLKSIPWGKGLRMDKDEKKAVLTGEFLAELDEGGEIGFASPPQSSAAPVNIQQLEELFRVTMNWPRVRSGQISSAIWTGRGIDAAQGAVSDDILFSREALARGLRWLDDKAVSMQLRFWGAREMDIIDFGEDRLRGVRIVPKQDIVYPWRHELVTFALANDITSKAVLLMQLYGQRLIDRQTVIEQLPGLNPSEILRRLEFERDGEMRLAMEMQQKQLAMQETSQRESSEDAGIQNEAMRQGQMPPVDSQGGLLPNGLVPTPNPPMIGYIPR